MSTPPVQTEGPNSDTAWAKPVGKLSVANLPAGAVNLNVEGRQLTGPLQGFGQLWQKTYKMRLGGSQVTPKEVIKVWKEEFPTFWPKGNNFYGPLTGIKPGEVAVLNLAGPGGITAPGGRPLISTGVMVIYADDESFSFMTPQGHMFASFITFSAFDDEGTVVQIQAMIRASDPFYELGFRLGIVGKNEDEFWHQTMKNLANRFGVSGYVQQDNRILDPHMQWSEARNIRYNAMLRTGLYLIASPFRWFAGLFRRKQ